MSLYVSHGSYAFVFIESAVQSPTSECPYHLPRCDFWYLAWIRDWAMPFPPGRDHITSQFDPPDFDYNRGKSLSFYLLTDGDAKLVLRPEGFSGSSSYLAGGRVHAKAMRLPTACTGGPCDAQTGYADTLDFGGESFNVGKLGVSGDFAYSVAKPDPQDDVQAVRRDMHASPMNVCLYPNPSDAEASGEAQAHPYGCDPLPRDPTNETQDATFVNQVVSRADGLQPTAAYRTGIVLVGRTGLQYQGYQIASRAATTVKRGAYAFWFSYGISSPAR